MNPKQKKGHLIGVLDSYIKNHKMIFKNGKLYIIYDYAVSSVSNSASKYITMIDLYTKKKIKSLNKLPPIGPETQIVILDEYTNTFYFFLKIIQKSSSFYTMNLLSAFKKFPLSCTNIICNLVFLKQSKNSFLFLGEVLKKVVLLNFGFIKKQFEILKTFKPEFSFSEKFIVGDSFYCTDLNQKKLFKLNKNIDIKNIENVKFEKVDCDQISEFIKNLNQKNTKIPSLLMKDSYQFENYEKKDFFTLSDEIKEKLVFFSLNQRKKENDKIKKEKPLKNLNILNSLELVDGTIFLYCNKKNIKTKKKINIKEEEKNNEEEENNKPICYILTPKGLINIKSNGKLRKKFSLCNYKEFVYLIGGEGENKRIDVFDLLLGDWTNCYKIDSCVGINKSIVKENFLYIFYFDNGKFKILIYDLYLRKKFYEVIFEGFGFCKENELLNINTILLGDFILFYFKNSLKCFKYDLNKKIIFPFKINSNFEDEKLNSKKEILYFEKKNSKEIKIYMKYDNNDVKIHTLEYNNEMKEIVLNQKNLKAMNDKNEKDFFSNLNFSEKNLKIFRTNKKNDFTIFLYHRYENFKSGTNIHKKSIVFSENKIYQHNLNLNRVKELNLKNFEFPKFAKVILTNKNQIALVGGYYMNDNKIISNGITLLNIFTNSIKKLFFEEISLKNHCVIFKNSKIIILGGENLKGEKVNRNYYYDLNLKKLRDFPNFVEKRSKFDIFKLGSKILVLFGEGINNEILSTIEVYNESTNEWTVLEQKIEGLKNFKIFSNCSDRLHILGGTNKNGKPNLKVKSLFLKSKGKIIVQEKYDLPQNLKDFEIIQHYDEFYLYTKDSNNNYTIIMRNNKIKFRKLRNNFFSQNKIKIKKMIEKKQNFGCNSFTLQNKRNYKSLYIFGTNLIKKIFKLNLETFQWSVLKRPEKLQLMDHSSCISLSDGKIFIGGGLSSSLTTIHNTCYILDLSNKKDIKVKTIAPMIQKRYTFPAIELNGFVYALGGRQYGNAELGIYDKCERYDIEKNMWKQIANLNCRRCTSNSTIYNNQIYIFGGYFGSGRVSEIEKYNEVYNKWELIQMSLQFFIDGGLLLHTSENEILIVGGKDEYNHVNNVTSYNLETGVVIKKEILNKFHTLSKGAVFNDLAICLGGCNSNEVEVFDLPYEKCFVKEKIGFIPLKNLGKTLYCQSK